MSRHCEEALTTFDGHTQNGIRESLSRNVSVLAVLHWRAALESSGIWIGLLVLGLLLLQPLSVVALVLDMRRFRIRALEGLAWTGVFLLFGLLGSMLYLAATDSAVPRAVIPLQLLIVLAAIGILSVA